MALDSLYTDALQDTSLQITFPEWDRVQATANIWSRNPEPTDVDVTLEVDGQVVANETVTVQSAEAVTAVERWRRMDRFEVTVDHAFDALGEHTVAMGEKTRNVLTLPPVSELDPVPDRFRTWNGEGAAGEDGRYGAAGDGFLTIEAGTDTDAWNHVNAFNAMYVPDGLEDGGSVTVKVLRQEATNGDGFTKGGLVVRNQMDAPAGPDVPEGKGMVRVLASPPDSLDRLSSSPGDGPYGRFSVEWDQDGNGRAMADQFPPTYYGDVPEQTAWMRLEKNGTNYTALYSVDGENFTEMTTVEVAGAAATQDVGLWAVALAPERCRQDFADFTIRNP